MTPIQLSHTGQGEAVFSNCVTGCVIQEMERADLYEVPIIRQLVYKEGTSVHCFLQSSYTFVRLWRFREVNLRIKHHISMAPTPTAITLRTSSFS